METRREEVLMHLPLQGVDPSEVSYVSSERLLCSDANLLLRSGVEREVGLHTSLDAPSQFPNYVCLCSVDRTHGLPPKSENIISHLPS